MLNKKLRIVKFKGGLGNQLFQYGLYKYFESKNYKVYADLSFYQNQKKYKKISKRKFYLNKILKKNLNVIKKSKNIYQFLISQRLEKFFTKLFKLDINLPLSSWEGYWQDIFFAKYVRKKDFKEEFFKTFEKIPKKYFILHYRSGDFKYSESHIVINHNYYLKALKRFKKLPIIALSDDNKNLKKMLKKININKKIIELKKLNTLDSFKILVSANGGICSNSTFSWWASFINEEKNWVYPYKWLKNINTQDTNLKISKNKIIK